MNFLTLLLEEDEIIIDKNAHQQSMQRISVRESEKIFYSVSDHLHIRLIVD
jgi:hypothetical protein